MCLCDRANSPRPAGSGRAWASHIQLFCGPGLDILVAGRARPGPHNSICRPGPGRVFTTAAGPGRAWASNNICGPGLGLDFRPVQDTSSHCLFSDITTRSSAHNGFHAVEPYLYTDTFPLIISGSAIHRWVRPRFGPTSKRSTSEPKVVRLTAAHYTDHRHKLTTSKSDQRL